MNGVDRERVARLLGQPELTRLIAAVRRRLESGAQAGRISLTGVSDAERRAVSALFGRPVRSGATLGVDLTELESMLQRAGVAPDLESALVALGGPLSNRRAERQEAARAWAEACRQATALAPEPLRPWVDAVLSSGLLKRQAQAAPGRALALLNSAFAVHAELPARGITLSALAAQVVGDAHALDRGRPLGTLVRSLVAWLGRKGLETAGHNRYPEQETDGTLSEPHAEEQSPSAEQQENDRALWAAVGVLVGGDITSTVLVLNLPAEPDTRTGRVLALWREAGEPGYLTLRQLLRDPPRWRCAGRQLFICENPAIVAEAAGRLGERAAPLVCTLGRPRAAALTLLNQLATAGAQLRYHGDFDWPGIAIANQLFRRYPLTPWHFDTASLAAGRHLPGGPLTGRMVEADWDDRLAAMLAQRGCALHEEQQVELLLSDLAVLG